MIDGIPSNLIKNCPSFSIILHNLYNHSISISTLPAAWKSSIITPVHKQGSINEVINYRPIAQLPPVAKVFDNIITSKLNNIIIPQIINSQHGFVPNKSVITNLLIFNDFISNSLNNHTQSDVIYFDFSKAFDKIDHFTLINKLKNFGIGKQL